MSVVNLSAVRWRKSSYSNGGGDGSCVEGAFTGPVLVFGASAWRRFLASV